MSSKWHLVFAKDEELENESFNTPKRSSRTKPSKVTYQAHRDGDIVGRGDFVELADSSVVLVLHFEEDKLNDTGGFVIALLLSDGKNINAQLAAKANLAQNELFLTLLEVREPIDSIVKKVEVSHDVGHENLTISCKKIIIFRKFYPLDSLEKIIDSVKKNQQMNTVDYLKSLFEPEKSSKGKRGRKPKASIEGSDDGPPAAKRQHMDTAVEFEEDEDSSDKNFDEFEDQNADEPPLNNKRKPKGAQSTSNTKRSKGTKKAKTLTAGNNSSVITDENVLIESFSNGELEESEGEFIDEESAVISATRRKKIEVPPSAFKDVLPTLPRRPPINSEFESDTHGKYQRLRANFHASSIPASLPCREDQFSAIFLALENAITSGAGTSLYVSGTPGTGKTATVHEVIAQLDLRAQDGEIPSFKFVEVNGMKLPNSQYAYEILWSYVNDGSGKIAANSAVPALEMEFKTDRPERLPVVVLMDELDELGTRNQGLMYNFFNWPTFPHSKLIVIAVGNTMDLPDRYLSNKVSSRLGLTRIQFPGYSNNQLKEIINNRISEAGTGSFSKDAIEFLCRKIAGVSGDARRALDLCRRAVEIAAMEDKDDESGVETVQLKHVREAINVSAASPLMKYLQGLPLGSKIMLCAVLARIRRTGIIETSMSDVFEESENLVTIAIDEPQLRELLFSKGVVRMNSIQHCAAELVEGGILVQQQVKGERCAHVRLSINESDITAALQSDRYVGTLV